MKAVIAKFITLYCLIALECARAQTWTLTSANPTFSWTCVASSADGNKLAGTAGGIYLSTNSGAAWITSSAPAAAWSSIASSADGARLIAANGSIYISTNSGGTWTASKPPGNLVASSADGSKLMAVQATGLISVSTNSGYTWFLGTNLSRSWSRIACSADGTKMAAVVNVDDCPVYVSTNCGLTWCPAPPIIGQPGAAIAWTADGSKLMLVTANFFYVSTNWGLNWASTNNNAPFGTAMACSANGSILATGGFQEALDTSTNFGISWTSNAVPAERWTSFASSADGNELLASAPNGIWKWQIPPMPQLNDSVSNGSLNLSWIVPSIPMVLQQSRDLFNWTVLTDVPSLNQSNLTEQLAISATNGASFFRLESQ